jgi:hypothetical protein
MKRVIIPKQYCIHNRNLWLLYIAFYGIDIEKEFLVYRDMESNLYAVAQDI